MQIAHTSTSLLIPTYMPEFLPQDSGEKSLWSESAIADPVSERLIGPVRADVLVVGGGYTGLSSALHLAQSGVRVVLLEAKCIGYGGSGRNAGLVNAGMWKNPDHVQRQLGMEIADRFSLALRDSPALVFDLVRQFDMSCKAIQCGTVNIAHKASSLAYLEDRCGQLQAIGAPVTMIDGNTAQTISGSPVYRHGGILDPSAGTIQPLSYARSLARVALQQGAQLYRNSAIENLAHKEGRWIAKTEQGEVSAQQVIIATNAYADSNSQNVRESTIPIFIFQCATPPLPVAIAESIIPQRQGLWDTQTLMTSSRIDDEGRLIMSSAGSLQGFHRSIRENWMRRMRERIYPQTRGVPWANYWTGQVGVTWSKILRIQLLAPGVYAPAGYNGRGIGTGTLIGKHLADSIVKGNTEDFPFPLEVLYHEKWRRSRAAYYSYGTLALQTIDSHVKF